jgi:hypothetical protein
MALEIIDLSPSSPYTSKDSGLLTPSSVNATFNPDLDYIEYVVQTKNKSFIAINYDYKGYKFPNDGTVTSNDISNIIIDPIIDLSGEGIGGGDFITNYGFYRNQLNTSAQNRNFFIKEISGDRTELVLGNAKELYDELVLSVEEFKSSLNDNFSYFEDFYLNFGNSNLFLANNIDINKETGNVIINLYQPLPNNITLQTQLWIVTEIADSLAFNIVSTPDPVTPSVLSFQLRGPNFNINVNDQINNSTDYQTYSTLITSSLLSTSYSQLNNLISSSGIEVNIDYTDFANFINFSSPVQRIKNFAYKVAQISASQAEINILTGSFATYNTSSNINILTEDINRIISNFDGYEYFLYYDSSSYTWPKSTSTLPYQLYSPTSAQVINWLGNENPNSPFYGGILSSGSVYNTNNPDYLVKSIPDYLRDDPQNAPYTTFIELIGQHFDNIWIYYKDVTNLYQADNRLDYGISKDLVAQALQSFGVKLYQNNFTSQDLYSSFLGYESFNPEMTGSLPVTAGSFQDYINNYVTASYEASVTPLDDYNKEIYKRIYHNLPYLTKTKGTIPGLRALINCFGVPDTVLRISEFGGRDKDTSTYDYFDQQFNYAFYNTEKSNPVTSSFTLNPIWGAGNNKPESIQLRIKPLFYPYYTPASTQSLFEISGSVGGNYFTNLTLWYTGSGESTEAYSGSIVDPYYQYGTLILDTKGDLTVTCSIYAPFFDGNWWSIQINRSGSFGDNKPTTGDQTFLLTVGSSGYYDGYDGNKVMHLYSSSIKNVPTWGYSGSKISFFDTPVNTIYSSNTTAFAGLSQEIRYWATPPSESSFKDYVMNPQSIDLTGENTYSNKLAARLPLGGDLYTGSKSVHPKITGSWTTTSSFTSNSDFYIFDTSSFIANVEPRFLNSPIIGLRGRVTDKIQIVSSSLPTGSVLSQYISLEQEYPSLSSESPDVNLLEVAFSPQNEINDDIIDSLGYFNIGEYIGDPRQISSSATSYPDLNNLSYNFFQKYFDTYDLQDYVRLIKYFDNSLFKMIKDFTPARTSLISGIVIKQHILERNKYPQPQVDDIQYQNMNISSSGGILSSSFNYGEDLTYSGSIQTAFMSGSTGGTFDQFNNINFTQSWIQTYTGSTGVSYISHSSQDEFYNGELPGTEFIVTNGELNPDNEFKYPTTLEIYYNPTLYLSNITTINDFLNINTSPNQGEVYLWFDTGSAFTSTLPFNPVLPQ